MHKTRLGIDFETRSEVDLGEVSTDIYVRHPSTRVILTGWCIDDGRIEVTEGEYLPPEVVALLNDPLVEKYAHNSTFEIAVLKHRFMIEARYREWVDTMVMARYLSFPAALANLPAALGLEVRKNEGGTALKTRFCQPSKATKKQVKAGFDPVYWANGTTHPEEWELFKTYNRDDVAAMREALREMETYPAMPAAEWNVWRLDQKIGLVGIPTDALFVENANLILTVADRKTTEELAALTGIDNLNSVPQWKEWLEAHGFPMPSIAEQCVIEALYLDDLPELVRQALELRQKLSGAGPKKLPTIQRQVSSDGRLRSQITYYGATTGRFSGRGVQPHNLPRPDRTVKDRIEEITDCIRAGSLPADLDIATAITSTVRSAFRAFPGHHLVQADYASIEPRTLAWLADCTAMLEVFRTGRDIYQDFAARFYGIPYDRVSKDQRNSVKAIILGGGYGLGWERLMDYAKTMGVILTPEQSQDHIRFFREQYPEIPALWAAVERLAFAAVQDHARYVLGHGVFLDGRDERFLKIDLPSGRSLFFHHPVIAMVPTDYGLRERLCFVAPKAGGGPMQPEQTRGPKLVENLIQAIARDILVVGLLRAHLAGLKTVLHVHDELLVEEPDDSPNDETFLVGLLERPVSWAPGLLLKAEGKVAQFYQK